MGFNISYLAAQAPIPVLFEAYHLQSGQQSDGPLPEDETWMATLANDWTIWWVARPDAFSLNMINPHRAAGCARAPVFAVSIAESNMSAGIAKYSATSKRWSISHEGDNLEKTAIKTTGNLPKDVMAQRDAVFAEQLQAPENVDVVFDLPARVGDAIFAFRYDRVIPDTEVIRWVRPTPMNPNLGPMAQILGIIA